MGEDGEWSNEDPLKFVADPDVGADPGIFIKVNCLALVEMCFVQNNILFISAYSSPSYVSD